MEDNAYSKRAKKKCLDRAYPINVAASNEQCPNSVVELLAKSNPTALKHIYAYLKRGFTIIMMMKWMEVPYNTT